MKLIIKYKNIKQGADGKELKIGDVVVHISSKRKGKVVSLLTSKPDSQLLVRGEDGKIIRGTVASDWRKVKS